MMEGVRGSGRGYRPRTNRYPLSEKAPNTHTKKHEGIYSIYSCTYSRGIKYWSVS